MLRVAAILIVLFLLAGSAIAAVFIDADLPGADFLVLGMGLAQVQLLAAALVFVRGWLWLRLLALTLVICFWANLAPIHFPETPAFAGCLLLSVALFGAAWCGLLHLRGVRLVADGSPNAAAGSDSGDTQRGQFSLATLLLIMGVVGVYLGLLRAAGIDWQSGLVLVVVVGLALPICLLLTVGAAPGLRARAVAITLLFYIVLMLFWELEADRLLAPALTTLLTVQLLLVAAAAAVLRIAGIRLVRKCRSVSPRRTTAASSRSEASAVQNHERHELHESFNHG